MGAEDADVRLWELWYQQFGDHFDVKFGEQSLDNEFMSPSGTPSSSTRCSAGPGPTGRFARRRPRLSARLPGHGRTRAGDGRHPVVARVFNGARFRHDGPGQLAIAMAPASRSTGLWRSPRRNMRMARALRKAERRSPLPGVYKLGAWYDGSNSTTSNTMDGRAARQSLERRDAAPASRRLFTVRCHGPDDLAFERQRQSQPECLLPSNVHALRGSQSRQRQHQRGLGLARSIAGARR